MRYRLAGRVWTLVALFAMFFLLSATMVGHVAATPSYLPDAPGDLDPNFGDHGKVTYQFECSTIKSRIASLLAQPDGKVIAVGRAYGHGGYDFALARYNPDGALDPTFGTNGIALSDFGDDDEATSAALQPDGKIVVGGSTTAFGDVKSWIARFNPDGSLDHTFHYTSLNDDGAPRGVTALALAPDGRIAITGQGKAIDDVKMSLAIAVLAPNGVKEGGSGFTTIGYTTGVSGGRAVIFATNNGAWFAVAAGFAFNGDNNDFMLVSQSGSVVRTDFFGGQDDANAIAVTPDGKIVLAGSATITATGRSTIALARYTSDKRLDPDFGDQGKLITDISGLSSQASALVIALDGKMLVAGLIGAGSEASYVLLRYNTDGSLDQSFGAGGIVRSDPDSALDQATSLALLPDNGVALAGVSIPDDQQEYFALAKYSATGQLARDFGGGAAPSAVQTVIRGWASDAMGALVVLKQPDGKILLGGFRGWDEEADLTLARLLPNGSLDPSFGFAGFVATGLSGPQVKYSYRSVLLQPDGKIVVAGNNGDYLGRLERFRSDGSLDTTFGSGGVSAVVPWHNIATGVALQADGKILVTGDSLARFNDNGTLDTTFGVQGAASDTFSGYGTQVLLDYNDRILVAGIQEHWPCGYCGSANAFVARFSADGHLDRSFAGDGVTEGFNGWPATPDMALQADHKLLLTADSGQFGFGVMRFNDNGSLDTSFGANGLVSEADLQDSRAVAAQPDGKIVVVGGNYSFIVARYNPDGSRDNSFGVNGVAQQSFAQNGNEAWSVLVGGDGSLLVAGAVYSDYLAYRLIVARYLGDGRAVQTPTPGSGVPTPTLGAGCVFSDVCPDDYFYAPVKFLLATGAVSGYNDGAFVPYHNTTRGQLVKILTLAEGWEQLDPATPHFNDTAPTNPFYRFIETAYSHGVVSGYSDGSFRWQSNVTRGQLAKIIVGAAGWPLETAGGAFSDTPPNSPFYGFIETAFKHGAISGYADGRFKPVAPATRGQVAKVVYELVGARKK